MSSLPPTLRIGIDVGGTNTDGVLLDPSVSDDPTRAILSWYVLYIFSSFTLP